MDEKTTTGAAATENATPQATVAQPGQTPSTAGNVDVGSIIAQAETKATAAAEKKMEAVFKSMLQQQGFDADAIAAMTTEWKSKQTTPEQTIAQLQGELAAERASVEAYEQEKVLRGHGLADDEEIALYRIRIGQLIADGKTFKQAADEYFEAHPRPTKAPATATFGGTGKTPMTPSEKDTLTEAYSNAKKNRDSARMAALIMEAKQKGVSLY